jgi:hypothetical protein
MLELNPSTQCCLRFFTGDFASWTCISLIYGWKTKKCNNYSFSYLCMVAPTCFDITLPSSGSVPSAFWELLNWGAVDRILWMGVLCLVMRCVIWDRHAPRHYIHTELINWMNWCICWLFMHILLGILIFKRLTARGLYTSFGIKGLKFNNCTLCPHCIYVFGIYLRTNDDLCHLQHKLIDFNNRDEVFTAWYGLGLWIKRPVLRF